MTGAYVSGAITGLALFLFVYAVTPQRVSLAKRIAMFEAEDERAVRRRVSYPADDSSSGLSRRLGAALARFCAEQGWEFPSLRSDLDLVGRSFDSYLASSAMLAVLGLLFPMLAAVAASLFGLHLGFFIPLWGSLLIGAFFALLPFLEVKSLADKRRRDFRHAIGAFLDLVAMNLSGGRGVPEALMTAGDIGEGWAFWRIRDALANARITGLTPWQALGALGEEVQVSELKDLAAALGLVADDGAKVRDSLSARAASLRRRELADLEGQAAQKSQSMLVAQMLLAFGFLVFLMYPSISILMSA
jgi:tight adherence protein C